MPDILLASAGEGVKLWEGGKYSLSRQIESPSNVSQVCWSPNGQFLATSSLNQTKIPVYFCKKPLTQPLELLPEIPQSYVRFGNTSNRFVLTCGNSPAVTIWDLKTRKASKKLNTGLIDGVTCAAYNSGDTHVASGGHNGSVVLTNAISSVSLAPMLPSIEEPQAVTSMQFSAMKRNLLGTVSDDGSCVLWDCNSRVLLHSFSGVHVAPATGIAFSPTNEVLLATVGLDKRLFYYDLQFQKTVITVKLEHPSTCVDFSADGMYVAVGGYKGLISIYDVRSSQLPVNVISAHGKAVSSVAFNKLPSAAKNSYFTSNITTTNTVVSQRHHDNGITTPEIGVTNTMVSQRHLENGMNTPEIGSRDSLRDSNSNHVSCILSPITHFKLPEITSIAPETHSFQETSKQDASTYRASGDNARVSQFLPDLELSSMFSHESSSRAEPTTTPTVNSERCRFDVDIATNVPSSNSFLENGTETPSNATNGFAKHSTSNRDDPITSTSMTNEPPADWREEMKYEIYKVRQSLHQDVLNLQFEMVKNFFQQKNEFEEMLGYRNLAANLMAEVNALKKEVANLKKHY